MAVVSKEKQTDFIYFTTHYSSVEIQKCSACPREIYLKMISQWGV